MRHILLPLALIASPLLAEEDPGGVLNPKELTWESMLDRAERGETNMTICATGYFITKEGDHAAARRLFERCAAAGYTGTMTWMSQMENNGLGGEYDPDAAARWDRQAAEAGDPVGKFNHGLNLIRGHGTRQDEALGRAFIDEAAAEGLDIAQRMVAAGYDPAEVTPDADEWKYQPLF